MILGPKSEFPDPIDYTVKDCISIADLQISAIDLPLDL